MSWRSTILLAFVVLSLTVGGLAGYRLRISQEHVTVPAPVSQWIVS